PKTIFHSDLARCPLISVQTESWNSKDLDITNNKRTRIPMKKFAKTLMSTLSILGCASYLYAVPTLVISDNNGNTTGVIPVPTGTTTFSGVLGNWNFNVVTVIGAPPAAGGTVNNPYLDVNSIDRYIGAATGGAAGS